jgi:helicase MOV-10
MLFPINSDGADQLTLNTGLPKLNLYDLKLNYEQVKAVNSVLKHNYGAIPYLISGPPGTGKTKTIVEIALQLSKNTKSNPHILMCAPSDPAADTLVLRLREHFKPGELLRLNAPSRTFAEVKQELILYTYIENNHHFSIPPFKELMRARIVVFACQDADILVKARVTNEDLYNLEANIHSAIHPHGDNFRPQELHWTALLMDEAGQATEPESLIPLTVLMPPIAATHLKTSQVVMAGDHKQLGPRTASHSQAIETSLFERLLERPCYANHPLARHRVGRRTTTNILTRDMLPIKRPAFTNLIRNYRSHPAILAVPNHEFYYDSLLSEAPDTDLLLTLPIWKGRKWPVLLCGHSGNDEHETDGGGWYNISEIRIARQYALEILKSGLIAPKDICIMSPFQSQVRRLRRDFRKNGMRNIDIGPMEAFQGLESRFVILCTTRSRDRFLDQDKARGFGIIHEPKRFNVALTRAKQGLIVIGNPALLAKDIHWKAFLSFCARNGLVDGEINEPINEALEIPALERILVAAEDMPLDRQLGEIGGFDDEMQVLGERDEMPGEEDEEAEEDEVAEDDDRDASVRVDNSESDGELGARLALGVAGLVDEDDDGGL